VTASLLYAITVWRQGLKFEQIQLKNSSEDQKMEEPPAVKHLVQGFLISASLEGTVTTSNATVEE